jgi:hypothetical protein
LPKRRRRPLRPATHPLPAHRRDRALAATPITQIGAWRGPWRHSLLGALIGGDAHHRPRPVATGRDRHLRAPILRLAGAITDDYAGGWRAPEPAQATAGPVTPGSRPDASSTSRPPDQSNCRGSWRRENLPCTNGTKLSAPAATGRRTGSPTARLTPSRARSGHDHAILAPDPRRRAIGSPWQRHYVSDLGHLRPPDYIMPDHGVIEAQCASVLEPHDHFHINQMSAPLRPLLVRLGRGIYHRHVPRLMDVRTGSAGYQPSPSRWQWSRERRSGKPWRRRTG